LDPQRRVLKADLRIDPEGRIDALLPPGRGPYPRERSLSLPGRIIMPGLIQSHVHLCQTVMRGMAERLPLIRWLRERIWPLEAAHDAETLESSARLGLLELLTGGTTAILDMGTTRHLETILQTCEQSGIRAVSGLAVMDVGTGVPEAMRRDVDEVLTETGALLQRYGPGRHERIGLCLAPRFIPSVSEGAWRRLSDFADKHDLLIHTHACETREEIELTVQKTGTTPFRYLERVGVAGPRLRAAHGVWLDEGDRESLVRSGAGILHCPGANAKLGSGLADVVTLWDAGVGVGIGTDGAPCNNRHDGFEELRRAAAGIATLHGPEAVDAARILEMAGPAGAHLLGLEEKIGSLEPGKEADLIVLNPAAGPGLWSAGDDLHAQVLHGAGRENIEQVWIGGELIVRRGVLRGWPAAQVLRQTARVARTIRQRLEDPS
jgi:cytosine/adenosine deaminase-related metal-dependent hydrolase